MTPEEYFHFEKRMDDPKIKKVYPPTPKEIMEMKIAAVLDGHNVSIGEYRTFPKKLIDSHQYFVYVLLKGSEVLYVGYSFNIKTRVAHHKYRKLQDHSVLVYCGERRRFAQFVEALLIKKLNPIQNKMTPPIKNAA